MPQGRLLFVSDLHLDRAAPLATEAFLSFLRDEVAGSAGLYILGDLFESWIGDDDDDAERRRICEGLRRLTGAGVPCRVQHGNRDFLLGAGFAARTGCELLPDPFVLETPARRIVLSHGDALCTRDVAYQRFRRVVRRRGVQRFWRALPAELMDVTDAAVETLLRETDADLLVHGHTHRPGVHLHRVDGRERTRIVLGDWYEQGSVLELDALGAPALRTLSFPTPPANTPGGHA